MYIFMFCLVFDALDLHYILNNLIYLLLCLSFFSAQLLLCLRSKKRWVQLIPMFLLLIALIECIGFFLHFILTYEYWMHNQFWTYIPGAYVLGFGPLWIDIAIAWLTAHIIKKRKAKKQNSVTQ